jgi:hypothetical protein
VPSETTNYTDKPSRIEGASLDNLSATSSNSVDRGGLGPTSLPEPNEPIATESGDQEDPFTFVIRRLTEEFPKHREKGFPTQSFFAYLEMLNDSSGFLREDRYKFVDYYESWSILPRSVAYGKVTASPRLPPIQRLNTWARRELQPGWIYDDEFVPFAQSPALAIGDAYDDHIPFAQFEAADENGETASHASQA